MATYCNSLYWPLPDGTAIRKHPAMIRVSCLPDIKGTATGNIIITRRVVTDTSRFSKRSFTTGTIQELCFLFNFVTRNSSKVWKGELLFLTFILKGGCSTSRMEDLRCVLSSVFRSTGSMSTLKNGQFLNKITSVPGSWKPREHSTKSSEPLLATATHTSHRSNEYFAQILPTHR